MSQNTVNTAITGGVLGALTVPTITAVATGATVGVLLSLLLNSAKK